MLKSVSGGSECLLPKVLQMDLFDYDESNNSYARAHIDLALGKDLGWFKGHFNDFPILPGVAQLDWVMHFIAKLSPQGQFVRFDKLKFMKPIVPSDCLSLSLNTVADNRAVAFVLFDGNKKFSSGNVVLRYD